MARLPIPRRRRTKAQVVVLTARSAVKTAQKTIAATPRALKLWLATAVGKRVAPVAGAFAAMGALLTFRRRRRKKQEQGLGLYEPPPPATTGGVSPPPDPETRRPKEAPGEAPAATGGDTPAGAVDPPLGPVPATEKSSKK